MVLTGHQITPLIPVRGSSVRKSSKTSFSRPVHTSFLFSLSLTLSLTFKFLRSESFHFLGRVVFILRHSQQIIANEGPRERRGERAKPGEAKKGRAIYGAWPGPEPRYASRFGLQFRAIQFDHLTFFPISITTTFDSAERSRYVSKVHTLGNKTNLVTPKCFKTQSNCKNPVYTLNVWEQFCYQTRNVCAHDQLVTILLVPRWRFCIHGVTIKNFFTI